MPNAKPPFAPARGGFFRAYPNVLVECLHSLTPDPWSLTSSSHFAIGRAWRLW